MSNTVAAINIVLGLAYTFYGVIASLEMKRDWRIFGFSHFGAAWIGMAFTCGPHHLFHGIHMAFEGRAGQPIDFLSVAVGLPFGIVWLFLRVEAFIGGRGDRFVLADPAWLKGLIPAGGLYLAALTGLSVNHVTTARSLEFDWKLLSNLALVGVYVAIGWFVLRTQFRNRRGQGGWSVSGLSLGLVFPTCALMHGVFALYAVSGAYHHDVHGVVTDFLSVPAALYFLWVVRRLYHDTLRDWNDGPDVLPVPVGAHV